MDEHALRPAGAAVPAAGHAGGFTKNGVDPQEPFIVAGGSPLDPDYGIEDRDWAGLLGRDGHLDRLPTERGAYPEFYRILAAKIHDGGAASALPVPVDPAGPVEVLRLIEQARTLAVKQQRLLRNCRFGGPKGR